jgi:hypothetical protein
MLVLLDMEDGIEIAATAAVSLALALHKEIRFYRPWRSRRGYLRTASGKQTP